MCAGLKEKKEDSN